MAESAINSLKTTDIEEWPARAPTLPFCYTAMSGRRSHQRFALLASPGGILRVMGDVVVQSVTPEQIVLVSRQPGIPGETVSVQSPDAVETAVSAQVVESHPIVIDGSVRHQLRLSQVSGTTADD
jgi:hypothetical protein